MLDVLGKHGAFDVAVLASGDIKLDGRHTVEDVAIVLGQVLRQALGTRRHPALRCHPDPDGRGARPAPSSACRIGRSWCTTEAGFKAVAWALRAEVAADDRIIGITSTKGTLRTPSLATLPSGQTVNRCTGCPAASERRSRSSGSEASTVALCTIAATITAASTTLAVRGDQM